MHLTKLLLIFLFFCIPLVHGNLLPTLGIPFSLSISGNFEFTKVMFFNILSGLIFLSFYMERIFFNHGPLRGAFFEKGSIVQKAYAKMQSLSFFKGKNSSMDSNYTPPKNSSMNSEIIVLLLLFILLLSTLFSTPVFVSLIGDTEKGHTAIMYFNLIGLFLILKNLEASFLQKLIFISLFSGVCISLLAVKEFFFPSFDYADLANRALGSFGHPNYLAGYLLLALPFVGSLFPFSKERIQVRIMKINILSLILLTLLLSKSIVALFLALGYILYSLQLALSPCRKELERGVGLIIFLGAFSLLGLILLIFYFPEKLHSFLSRFYLWETTLGIIFSDIKIFFIGAGAETLPYFFDSFKVPEVYIYENFGYTADRSHNFFLDIWLQFGIFGILLFLYCIFIFFKNFKNIPSPIKISLLSFLLFGVFHYFSIASYVMLILILSLIIPIQLPLSYSPHTIFSGRRNEATVFISFVARSFSFRRRLGGGELCERRLGGILLPLLTLLSLTGAYFSLQLYRAELAFASGNTKLAQEIFSHPKYLIELGEYKKAQKLEGILSSQNLKEQILTEPERLQNCDTLTGVFPSAEHYFYCGDIFWKLGKQDIARNYYRQGLTKLPDLWESDSVYWQQYFVHKSITGHRFFSPKFSDISEILQKLEIPIEGKK